MFIDTEKLNDLIKKDNKHLGKYTAIYIDVWTSGSQQHSLTKLKRFQLDGAESIGDALVRLDIAETTIYLFVGWPPLQGEENA